MLWGYSPALDLLGVLRKYSLVNDGEEVRILVAGAADARHVLKTIAKAYTHGDKIRMALYVCEPLLEQLSREILLVATAFEPSEHVGLMEKARMWMEIMGNTLLRPTTAQFVADKAAQLVRMVTDSKYMEGVLPNVSLDLKYKEKDSLETIFKFWVEGKFDIKRAWDHRVRKHLGERYDSRAGAYDWDYHMKLREKKKCKTVNVYEYKQWRNTGVAFIWLETEYSLPNNTLATGVSAKGEEYFHFGYLGDIINPPYFSFGLECEDEHMLKEANGMMRKRATDLTERNLTRTFHELENGTAYIAEEDSENSGLLVTHMTVLNVDDFPEAKIVADGSKYDHKHISSKHSVTFLSTDSLENMSKKDKYKDHFDLLYLSQNLIKRLKPELINILKNKGLLLIESRYSLLLTEESQKKYFEEIQTALKDCQCVELEEFNPTGDFTAFFQVKRRVGEGDS